MHRRRNRGRDPGFPLFFQWGGGPGPPCWKLLLASFSVSSDIIFCVISVRISLRTYPRAFQMQEASSPAYFTHYTNLFGSLSHQALARDSWSLWLMRLQMMLHWSLLKFTTCITRTLTWGQLCALPDLLNSCPSWHCLQGHQGSHPGKHTCRCTTAWLPACLVIEVDKLVRIYLTSPITTATGERSFSALRCIKTYLRWSTMSQQHLNNRMLLNVHKDLTDGLDLPTIRVVQTAAIALNFALVVNAIKRYIYTEDWKL